MSTQYPDHDPTEGWISAQEVRNVFTEALRRFDTLRHTPQSWDVAFKFLDSLQYELYRRSAKNYQEFIKTNPKTVLVKKAEIPDSREAHQKRLQALREKS